MARAIRTKKIQNLPDTRNDPDVIRATFGEDSSKLSLSEIAVPIIIHGKAVGVLNIENWQVNAYTKKDQEILEALASYAGLAISRIQYDARLNSLHEYASRLVNAQNVNEIADYTLDAMVNALELELCEFSLIQEGVSTSISVKGIDETLQLRERAQEFLKDPRQKDASDLKFRSELQTPVILGEEIVASLSSRSIRSEAYSTQDSELLETLASHVASAIQRILAKEEVRQLAYKLNNLKPGGCYISESHNRCFKAYAVLSMEGVPGLCIVREDPQGLMDDYGIKKEEIMLLSSRPFKEYETLADLQLTSRVLSKFLESGEGVVLLDGLEYLISRFGFDSVYSFVQEKRFEFLQSNAVLLVPLNMATIEGREKALLSSEFTLLE
jgi:GAF domain-containing protein